MENTCTRPQLCCRLMTISTRRFLSFVDLIRFPNNQHCAVATNAAWSASKTNPSKFICLPTVVLSLIESLETRLKVKRRRPRRRSSPLLRRHSSLYHANSAKQLFSMSFTNHTLSNGSLNTVVSMARRRNRRDGPRVFGYECHVQYTK